MNSERLKKVEEIYHAVLEVSPDKCDYFLAESCGDDEELRREVESLLSYKDTTDDLLKTPPESLAAEMFAEQDGPKDTIGKKINHYKIQSLLGKGGMGVVYLAEDTRLDRQTAIKFLSGEFSRDADKLKRFIREAKAASALNHPNILTVYEIGASGDSHYIAAEFIDGKVLDQHISGEKIPLASVLDIAIQIVSALSVAHSAGIVHRDIKPDNVMIRKDGIVKVLDFGLAKLAEKQSGDSDSEAAPIIQRTTTPGMIMGTPDYMSPEQARGKGVTHQTDIFSFGIVLYEMLSGKPPFKGDSAMDTIGAILHLEPLPLKEVSPQVPQDVEFIVNKTLRKNTSERYQNTDELLIDLRRAKQRLDYEKIKLSFPPEDSEDEKTQSFDSSDLVQTGNVPANNLTKDYSAIIGRKKEIAEITDLLRQKSVRLLTLTGIGGTGKTRLARAVARQMLKEFSDGVFFVALASITDFKLVASTIAKTLGVKETDGSPILETLKNHLREKKILLVVDNFEQVIDAGKDIAELLNPDGKLKILITSREILRMRPEREYAVSPLAVPADETQISANELLKTEAVRLFVERAQFAHRDFALTNENAASVAAICRRLDGLPLAIELAAARVKLLPPQAILTRLANSLKILTGGAKDLPERQRTMRGAIAWSYDLLDADEKKLFDRLAVFAGGFTLDGAEAIVSRGNSSGKRVQNSNVGINIYDAITSLIDKNLIIRKDQKSGEPRFRMLVIVREFALEKLAEGGEAEEIEQLHANFYADLSEKAKPHLKGHNAAQWLGKLEQEHDNLRAALDWSLQNDPSVSLRIVASIYIFWVRRGYLVEGSQWIKQTLEKSSREHDVKLQVEAYGGSGYLSRMQGNLEAAESFFEESLQLSRKTDDKKIISVALGNLGIVKLLQLDLEKAKTLIKDSLVISRETDDRPHIATMLNNLGEIARQQNDYEAARGFYKEAQAIAKEESLKSYIIVSTLNLASVACLLKDYQSARIYAIEALTISEELGDRIQTGNALDTFAAAAGKTQRAARIFGAAQAIYEATGYKMAAVDQKFTDDHHCEVRTAIGDTDFDTAFAEGRRLNVEEAIALAREIENDFHSA